MADITQYITEWKKGKEYVDNYIKDFKRLDTITNAQYDGGSDKNPNIGDTTIAGIVRQVMRTAVKQLPVVQIAINGSKTTVEALICKNIVNDRLLNPTTFGKGFVNTMHLAGRGALSRGFTVFQVSSAKLYGEFGVIPRIIHFNDFAIEPGVQDGSHSGYFYIRTKFTPSKLKRIYDMEKKNPTTTWNIKALKALIDIGPDSNGSTDYAQYLTEMEQNKQNANAETYDIITRLSTNTEQDICTFNESINEELRTVPNKSKFGFPRVILLVIDPAELSPFGDSRVRLASPNQNFLMALRQNVASTWLYNSKPAMVQTGLFTGATALKSGAKMMATDPNAKITLLTLDTATSQQYPTISQEITKQIQSMMGMNPGQSLGAIGESKTGVGAAAQKQGIDDAVQQVTTIIEELIRQYVVSALDLYLSEQSGEGVIYVDDDTRQDIIKLRPDAFPDKSNPNALAVNWDDLYGYVNKIDASIDTTISKEEWSDEERKDLQDALTVISQTSDPNDPNAMAKKSVLEDEFLEETVPEVASTLDNMSAQPVAPQDGLTPSM